MAQYLTLGAAQLGPIARADSRAAVVRRLIDLLRQAASAGCAVVAFPEMALTTFFPRWFIEDEAEIGRFFETEMPGPDTLPLFEEAGRLGVGFYLGYCELDHSTGRKRRFNSAVLVDGTGRIVGKYRKVHILGNRVFDPALPFQHMEPHYFETGDLGFPSFSAFGTRAGMCICNDRRWPETYRSLALNGADLVLLGYNTPAQLPDWPDQNELRVFHHLVCMQAGAYQNGVWIVAAAKAGVEEGVPLLGHSAIIAPSGQVTSLSQSLDDELIVTRANMDLAAYYKSFFDLATNLHPSLYTKAP
jgi:predicted amidohydrolase